MRNVLKKNIGLIVPVSALRKTHCLRLIVSDAAEIIAAPDGEPPNRPSVKTRGTEGILLFYKREDSVLQSTI